MQRPIGGGGCARAHARSWTWGTLVCAAAVAALLALLNVSRADGATHAAPAAPVTRSVTLITGDVVQVSTRRDGRRSISLVAGPDGRVPQASITAAGSHLYVIPRTATSLVAAGRLDRALFDVAGLLRQGYGDAHSSTLPVIVEYGRDAAGAHAATAAALPDARRTIDLPLLGVAAFAVAKRDAAAFWQGLTGAAPTARATTLGGGATRVDLDARVHAVLDPDVAQIHAPEAWAAGFDGTGATVAVLDTGYDPTHPDLMGRVATAQSFTGDPSIVDGNGHGTHVASTIAGTGAAEPGVHGGSAPGARLLVGKVLDDSGTGQDSWVLAGMQWAVQQGADVVNMSLGGDVSDGTDVISRAVDELSASSPTLFVIAAGNNGSDPFTVTSPGAASAALTVGAVDGSDAMAWFSSRGPRLGDHALKPDVVAPGVGIVAARAAGTSLGSPVDEWYTSLDGTSMATPHVSAVAAILKEEHPAWDGTQLKEAITESAVPVTDASGFDAGAGRVDAERAVHEHVLADDSLDLGWYPWPQSVLSPTSTPLAYSNTGATPVTLSLSVAGEDGGSSPPGVSLSATSLTIPAGGTASVGVLLDPRSLASGDYSGVVTADAGDGTALRTAFAYGLESEHYDLTVEVDPRARAVTGSHTIGVVNLATGDFAQKEADGSGRQSLTFRLPPGEYAIGSITFATDRDGSQDGVLSYAPDVRLHADTQVVLKERKARRFRYTTDRPVVSNGAIMSVDWSGSAGFAEFTLAGAVDRLYALPLASSPKGTVQSALNWLLAQPGDDPSYLYDLAGFWDSGVPAGATLDGSDAAVAALHEHYGSLGGTAADGYQVAEMLIGWIPGRGTAAYGLVRKVGALPGTVTHYVSPGPNWERDLDVQTSLGGAVASFYAPPAPVTAGTSTDDTWLGGPIGTAASPLISAQGWDWGPNRQGDTLYLGLAPWTDAAGHTDANLDIGQFQGALYQDGQEIMEADSPYSLWGDVPPERHAYRLDYSATRSNGFWQRSTTIQTSWWFHSQTPAGDHDVVPLMTAGYDLGLSDLATAHAGPQHVALHLGMPAGAPLAPATNVRVDTSLDGGASWQRASVRGCSFTDGVGTTCQVRVVNQPGTSVTLRLSARDTAGRALQQTIVDAYAVEGASE